jgi:hypothetical protein
MGGNGAGVTQSFTGAGGRLYCCSFLDSDDGMTRHRWQ